MEQGDLAKRDHTVLCLTEGMKKCIVKPICHEKVNEGTQEWDGGVWPCPEVGWFRLSENLPALTLPLLRDNPHLTSTSAVSQLLISGESCNNFNMALGPQWLTCWIWTLECENRDQTVENKRTQHEPKQAR